MFGIKTLTRKVDAIMATLADLTAALDANKAAVDAAVAKIDALKLAAQPVDLQPAVDAVNASTAALNAAAA